MEDLVEKDPQLAAVVDKQSRRNLLDPANPNPLEVDTSLGSPIRFALEVANGPEGLINLAVSADEPWLEAESNRVTLVGGEKGDCVFRAKPDGNSEFANIIFSWEGNTKTHMQPVLIRRKLAASSSGDSSHSESQDSRHTVPSTQKPARADAIRNLTTFIDACGGPDKFIDIDEEHKIFRKGGMLELSLSETESILNRRCGEGGWTRQSRLTEKLTAMLNEATKDDGVIDKQEYEHILNFAVKRLMPRRDADEHCVTLILNNAWRAKEGILDKWFTKKRKQYGL
jgi:hypothetical protein